jgi:hypothetical protein
LDPVRHVPKCELAVLLLGAQYDETTRLLADGLRNLEKPFVVWPSPVLENAGELEQRGFFEYLLQPESGRKTLLASTITPEKLKQEVVALLNPRAKLPPSSGGKPQVYLIYDDRRKREKDNAAQIAYHYKNEFHFVQSDDPHQHNKRLTQSDGVLLVWGKAEEEWCAREFEQIVRLSYQAKSRGLCLFDPKEPKMALAERIRAEHPAIHVVEQFGRFNPARLQPFFGPILNAQGEAA